MKATIYAVDGSKKGELTLPAQFGEDYRPDIIKRAVLAAQSNARQAYGTDPSAGFRTSAHHIARRRKYGTWANKHMHRTQRIRVGSGHMTGGARLVPEAVKGRQAHPPKAGKIWSQKINDKERLLAIRSGIAATSNADAVSKRNHVFGKASLPIVIEAGFEKMKKVKEVLQALEKIGLAGELLRTKEKKVRPGVGKNRGRPYRKKVGPLIIVSSEKEAVKKSAGGIPGVDVVQVDRLNAEVLAPGTKPGRLAVWTESAIDRLSKEKLYFR